MMETFLDLSGLIGLIGLVGLKYPVEKARAGVSIRILGLLGFLGFAGFWIPSAGAAGALGVLGLWNHQSPALRGAAWLGLFGIIGLYALFFAP